MARGVQDNCAHLCRVSSFTPNRFCPRKERASERGGHEKTRELSTNNKCNSRQSNRDDYQNIKFAKVDVDELKELAEELGVTSTPTVQLYKNGQRMDESVTPGPQALLQFIAHAQE